MNGSQAFLAEHPDFAEFQQSHKGGWPCKSAHKAAPAVSQPGRDMLLSISSRPVLVVPEVMLNLYPVSPHLQSQTTRNSNHQIEKEHPIQTVDYVSEEIRVDFLQYVYRYYR